MTLKEKNINIKNKFISHLILNGKKTKSEKIIHESLKVLQTISKKPSKKLIQLALVLNSPIFKLHTITQKKRKKKKQKLKIIPAFILNKNARTSFAVKFIFKTINRKKDQPLIKKLSEEILFSSKNQSNGIKLKKDTQKQVLLNRHLFKYYRWN